MISETPYSAQEVALSLLRPGATVLDVGCGDGSFARGARELACTVVGVDRSPAALDAMESEGFECINADLEQVDLVELLGERTFDHVVLLDVLEHLRQPEELLTALSKVLTDDGEMIVSILNVTHLSVRLAMLQGRFNDAGDGLLDRSHVRFFDRDGVTKLFGDAGLAILSQTEIHVDGSSSEDADELDPGVIDTAAAAGDASILSWVVVAGSNEMVHPTTMLNRLLTDSVERSAEIDRARVDADDLRARILELQSERDDARDEIDRLTQALDDALLMEREIEGQREIIRRMSIKIEHNELQDAEQVRRLTELETFYWAERNRADQAEALTNEVHERLVATHARLGYRFMDRTATQLSRFPTLFKVLRRVGRTIVNR